MEVKLSKLEIVKEYDPEIINLRLSSHYPQLYTFIRFWGRLPDYLLDDLMNLFKKKGKNILFDPFGGSGSVVFSGMNKGFDKIIFNDINPTFVFITSSIYNGLYIPTDVLKEQINKLNNQLLSNPIILNLLKMQNGMFIHKITFDRFMTLKKQKDFTPKFKNKKLNVVARTIIEVLRHKNSISFLLLRNRTIRHLQGYSKIEARALFSRVLNRLIKEGIIEEKIRKNLYILSSSPIYPKNLITIRANNKNNRIFERKEEEYRYLINKKVFSYRLKYSNGVPFKKAEGVETIGELYSTWSKILLSVIWKEIVKFPAYNEDLTNVFKTCFLASLYDASLMQMPHKSGWIIKSFWIPYVFATKNPLYIFIKKLNKFLYIHESFQSRLSYKTKVIFHNKDILDLSKKELKDKPDIVITHPPYFSTVQYGELSNLWASWLNFKIPFEKEIVENCRQGKDKNVYLYLLKRSLEKIVSLSRRDAEIVLIFQSKNQRNWDLLDRVLMSIPMELKQIRCYKRNSWWKSKHVFNTGDFDYAFIFRKRG